MHERRRSNCATAVASLAIGLTAMAAHGAEDPFEPAARDGAQAQAGEPENVIDGPRDASVVDLLSFHRPNYMITGFTSEAEVKFQVSVKYDLWLSEGPHAVNMGFTLKSLWDMWDFEESSPFEENNYRPELFYTYYHHPEGPPDGCSFFHQRLGLGHESNGEGGERSRSWNRIFVETSFGCYQNSKDDAGSYQQVALHVWAPPFGIDDNEDIVEYLGYGELAVNLGVETWVGDTELRLIARKGANLDFEKGSLETALRWRPGPRLGGKLLTAWRLTPYIFAQVFTGNGETLLAYDESETSVRVGLGFREHIPGTR